MGGFLAMCGLMTFVNVSDTRSCPKSMQSSSFASLLCAPAAGTCFSGGSGAPRRPGGSRAPVRRPGIAAGGSSASGLVSISTSAGATSPPQLASSCTCRISAMAPPQLASSCACGTFATAPPQLVSSCTCGISATAPPQLPSSCTGGISATAPVGVCKAPSSASPSCHGLAVASSSARPSGHDLAVAPSFALSSNHESAGAPSSACPSSHDLAAAPPAASADHPPSFHHSFSFHLLDPSCHSFQPLSVHPAFDSDRLSLPPLQPACSAAGSDPARGRCQCAGISHSSSAGEESTTC
mmetsp:Transcript_135194/g.269725  ORF Transcript_135194/g.269725 Transcript_135194/m.269725 type:complete len:296 (-) Transcript_135194:190-1077(-)